MSPRLSKEIWGCLKEEKTSISALYHLPTSLPILLQSNTEPKHLFCAEDP